MPQQQAFFESKAKIKGMFGGNRSGKTEEGAEYVINNCINKPGQRWWCVAENYKDSVNIQQRKIWSLVPKHTIKYGRYSEEDGFTHDKLIFKNKSVIIFKSYEQKRKAFQSDDLDGIWNDEEPPYDIYREERMRLVDRDGEMIFTMTALKGITRLLEDIFDGHTVRKSRYCSFLDETLPTVIEKDGAEFFMLWSTDNPHINQDRAQEEMKVMTKEETKARIFGIPVNLKGRVYPSFSTDIHVIKFKDVPWDDCSLINVVDPHDRKPWAVAWVAVDSRGTVYVAHEDPYRQKFNEIPYGDKTYGEYAQLFKDVERKLMTLTPKGALIDRLIDPNYGNTTVRLAYRQGGQTKTTPKMELAKHGLRYRDAIDALEAGHLKVREYLHYEVKDSDGQGEIVVAPKLYVCEGCQNVILHLTRYSRKDPDTPSGDVKDVVGVLEKYKDFSDLVRYVCMSNPRKKMRKPSKPVSERRVY